VNGSGNELGYRPESAGQALEGRSPDTQVAGAWRASVRWPRELIAERPASVRLTRSIAAPYKQCSKEQLGFGWATGIGELHPRRNPRATAGTGCWPESGLRCGERCRQNGALSAAAGASVGQE